MQSQTIKSYLSAIKKTLIMDGCKWNDDLVLVRSLAKACRIVNDSVRTRLPIHCGLPKVILFEVERYFVIKHQFYLEILYKTGFALYYYGMMRIGEVATSQHMMKAKDVHMAYNKDKLLIILYSSKTHDKGLGPQKIKITSNRQEKSGHYLHRHFCPFQLVRQYLKLRGNYTNDTDQFFIFSDGSPVTPYHTRSTLKEIFKRLNLNSNLYGMHSFRIGRTTDLIKYGYTIDEVKLMGRWRSNVIFKYIRC